MSRQRHGNAQFFATQSALVEHFIARLRRVVAAFCRWMGRAFDLIRARRLKLAVTVQVNRLLDVSGGAVELKVRAIRPYRQSKMLPAPISLRELVRLRTRRRVRLAARHLACEQKYQNETPENVHGTILCFVIYELREHLRMDIAAGQDRGESFPGNLVAPYRG